MKKAFIVCLLLALAQGVAARTLEVAAQQAVAAQRLNEARELYRRLSEDEPAKVHYLLWIARLSSQMQDYAVAREAYDRALILEPGNAELLLGKANILMGQQEFYAAEDLLTQAELIAPERADVHTALAKNFHYQGLEVIAEKHARRALALDPQNREAKELASLLTGAPSVELRVGYGHDRYSFVSPSHAGFITASYLRDSGRFDVHYERWNKFGEHPQRAGLGLSRRFGDRWWWRGEALLAPKTTVLPRHDYSAGFSRAFPHGVMLGGDSRYLRFTTAKVWVLSPSFEYHFEKPVWLQAVFHRSWTNYLSSESTRIGGSSFLIRYHQQVAKPLWLRTGYARGNESFSTLSVDRLGKFKANTYEAGLDLYLSSMYAVGLTYDYQQRSNRAHQKTLGMSLTLRK